MNTVFVIKYDFAIGEKTVHNASSIGISKTTIDGKDYYMVPVALQANKAIVSNMPIFNSTKTELLTDSQVYCTAENTTVHLGFPGEWEVYNVYSIIDCIFVPSNCVLKFEGGSVNNGVLKFNNTQLCLEENSFVNCLFSGDIVGGQINFSGFGPKCLAGEDDCWLPNSVIDICNDNGVQIILDFKDNIFISKPTEWEYPYNYGVRTNIIIKNNTHIKQVSKGWIILQNSTNPGGIVCSYPYHRKNSNVVLEGLKVDGNDIHSDYFGENGICVSGVIKDCIVKNCITVPSGTTMYGGKGISIESANMDTLVENCAVYDCFIGIWYNRYSPSGDDINYIVNSSIIEGCQIAICAINQDNSVSENYQNDNLKVSNCIIRNCVGNDGIISFSRVKGVSVTDTTIVGTNKCSSIIRGSFTHCDIDILTFQNCYGLLDFTLSRFFPYSGYTLQNNIKINAGHTPDNIFYFTDLEGLEKRNVSFSNFDICIYSNSQLVNNTDYLSLVMNNFIKFNVRDCNFIGSILDLYKVGTNIPLNRLKKMGDSIIGASTGRPSFGAGTNIGFQYFDTTLNKPIYWTGSAWVDATGTAV